MVISLNHVCLCVYSWVWLFWKLCHGLRTVGCLQRLAVRNGSVWPLSCPGSSPSDKLFSKLIVSFSCLITGNGETREVHEHRAHRLAWQRIHFLFPFSDGAAPCSVMSQAGSSCSCGPFTPPDSLPEAPRFPLATPFPFPETRSMSHVRCVPGRSPACTHWGVASTSARRRLSRPGYQRG